MLDRETIEIIRHHGLPNFLLFPTKELNAEALSTLCDMALRSLAGCVAVECEHEWVDARNQVIKSGELCIRCFSVRPGNAAAPGGKG